MFNNVSIVRLSVEKKFYLFFISNNSFMINFQRVFILYFLQHFLRLLSLRNYILKIHNIYCPPHFSCKHLI